MSTLPASLSVLFLGIFCSVRNTAHGYCEKADALLALPFEAQGLEMPPSKRRSARKRDAETRPVSDAGAVNSSPSRPAVKRRRVCVLVA